MSSYNILTLHAGKMLESYTVVPQDNKNNKVQYRYDLSSNRSLDQEVVLSEDRYEDNALFYQLKKCLEEMGEPLDTSDTMNDKDILKHVIVFVDFNDVFFKEKKFDTSKDYTSLSAAELKNDKSIGYRLQWMFDSDKGGIELIFKASQKKDPIVFVPFEKSSSMARNCQISFIRKDMNDKHLKTIADKRLMLGIDFSPVDVIFSKYYAYRGLYLSTGYRINHSKSYLTEEDGDVIDNADHIILLNEETVIVLPDDESAEEKHHVFSADRQRVATRPSLPEAKSSNKKKKKSSNDNPSLWKCGSMDKDIKLNFFDGEGLICPQYAGIINEQLKSMYHFRADSHSFQIRMPFTKGMLHEVDYCKFIREQASILDGKAEWIVEDVFSKPRDIKKAKIILTESMFKCTSWLKDLIKHHKNSAKCCNVTSESESAGISDIDAESDKPDDSEKQKEIALLLEDPMRYFFRKMEQYDHALYITGSDARLSNNGKIRLNYQFLSTLDIDFADFKKLVEGQRDRIEKVDAAFRNHGEQSIYTLDNIRLKPTHANVPVFNADGVGVAEESNVKKDGVSNELTINTADDVTPNSLGSEENERDKTARLDAQEILNAEEAIAEDDIDNPADNDGESSGNAVRYETVRGKCLSALVRNGGFIGEPQIKDIIGEVKKTYERNLCVGRLEVAGEQRYLSRDLLSMLIYILGAIQDVEGKSKIVDDLKKNCLYNENMERFYMPQGKIRLMDYLDYGFLRNPHLSRNEQCLLRPYTKPGNLYATYFSNLTGIVMVAYKSLVPMALSGADFDGDLVKIVAEKKVVNAIKRGVYSVSREDSVDGTKKVMKYSRKEDREEIDIPSVRASAEKYPSEVPFSVIVDTFANQVGQISNIAVTIAKHEYANKQAGLPVLQKQDDTSVSQYTTDDEVKEVITMREEPGVKVQKKQKDYTNQCSVCTIVTGLEIDAAKTGVHPEANISKLKAIVDGEKNFFLKAKDCIMDMVRNHRYFTPYVRIENDGRLSLCVSKTKKKPVKAMSKIVFYNEKNQPQAMIDYLPGAYLGYLQDGQQKRATGTKARKPLPRNRVLFCFQTQRTWKNTLLQADKAEVEKLVFAYVQIRKLARQLEAMRQRSKASKYIGHIFTILCVQYDYLDKRLSTGYTIREIFADTYEKIRNWLIPATAENGTESAEKAVKPVNDALEKLDAEKWQFTKENADKKEKLKKILLCEELDLPELVPMLNLLSNFSNNGFMILYYILKDIQSSMYEGISVDDYIEDAIEQGNARFVRPTNNIYYNELYNAYSSNNKQEKKVWNGNLVDICRRYLHYRFDDMSLALKYVFSVSDKDPRREFLWNVFTEDEILWNVYTEPRSIQIDWDKISISSLERLAKDQYSTVMKRLGDMYMNGYRVKKDTRLAENWYFKAADLCDMDALTVLADIYRNAKKYPQAAMCYRKLADLSNDMVAISDMKEMYLEAAKHGDMDAMFSLGILYSRGDGVERNIKDAIKWYTDAAVVLVKYGEAHNKPHDDKNDTQKTDNNLSKPNQYKHKAAHAMLEIGILYEESNNQEDALKWYEKSAKLGCSEAMNRLGDAYQEQGQYDDASDWYEKAHAQKHVDVICNLGYMYHHGRGKEKDTDRATLTV